MLKYILLCTQCLELGIGLLVLEYSHIMTFPVRVGGVCPALGAGAYTLAVVGRPINLAQIFTAIGIHIDAFMAT